MSQYIIGNWSNHKQSVVDEIKIRVQLAINKKRFTRGAINDLEFSVMIEPVGESSTPIDVAKFKVCDTEMNLLGYFYADTQKWEPIKKRKRPPPPPQLVIIPESRILRSFKTGAEYDKNQPYEVYNAHGWRGCDGCAQDAYKNQRISKRDHTDMLNRSSIRSRSN